MQIYNKDVEQVLQELKSFKDVGLSNVEVKERQEIYGKNALKGKPRTSTLKLFLAAFKDPLMIILLLVVVIKLIFGDFVEAGVIIAVLLINSIIGVVQTRKAESSLSALQKMAAPEAVVIRHGSTLKISAENLVPGDIVLVQAGDFIPADGRLLESSSLLIDEGILTGESMAVEKSCEILQGELPLGDRINMVFSSSKVTLGRGIFVVTETGANAQIGKIARLIEQAEQRLTPLQRKLESFSKKLGIFIGALCFVIFALQAVRYVLEGEPIFDGIFTAFTFAVALAVAAIPEALSSIVTLVLTSGVRKMAAKNAIIRKLPSVESLGSAAVICTDKTGTLTQNKMSVVDKFLLDDSEIKSSVMGKILALCNDGKICESGGFLGEATEIALLNFAQEQAIDVDKIRDEIPRIDELPFDSSRKMMSVLCEIENEKIMLTKGAPDVILARCNKALVNGTQVKIDDEIRAKIEQQYEKFSEQAYRVLAFCIKKIDGENLALNDENEMTFVGLTALVDPPRVEAAESVAQAKTAGIKVVMITGDHKTTAVAIARQIGIYGDGDMALSGIEVDNLNDDELLKILPKISVYARVSPENKIRIVRLWQSLGNITAMTGDGVNDAPSLKQADIGVAMGSGSEVSKDASAMVLTDDNFASIVSAVEIGRQIFDNIKKAISYLFSGNLGGIIVILFALIFGFSAPLTALQILFINLLNDALPALALGLEGAEADLMKRKPRDINEGILSRDVLQSVLIRGVIIGVVSIAALMIGLHYFNEYVASAMVFSTLILSRTLQTFSARSNKKFMLSRGFFKNKLAIIAVIICLGLYSLTLLPGMREIFSIADGFNLNAILISLGLSLAAILAMEVVKILPLRQSV